MVIKPIYSISIVVSITLCLLYVVLLGTKKLIFLRHLPLGIYYLVLVRYFEILLPAVDLKESLVGAVRSPDLVPCMKAFHIDIASTLLLVHLSVFLFTVLLH